MNKILITLGLISLLLFSGCSQENITNEFCTHLKYSSNETMNKIYMENNVCIIIGDSGTNRLSFIVDTSRQKGDFIVVDTNETCNTIDMPKYMDCFCSNCEGLDNEN